MFISYSTFIELVALGNKPSKSKLKEMELIWKLNYLFGEELSKKNNDNIRSILQLKQQPPNKTNKQKTKNKKY